jgi:hypothetical protein
MQLPAAIEAYFASDRTPDHAALTASFAPDAVVKDEGASHVGHAEILAWRLASTAKYANLVTEPVEQTVDGNRVIVRSRVSGDFPGSPAMLDFTFTLADQRISQLEIH